ncbi:MAG TPA: cobaltochelatase subunit CobN [Pyrinomonadaceae bacterium]|nr:cobaltochelatase subunit CobN [Pyrinomonadaceae bacterium]
MRVTVLYVGSSLLAPLKHAERELNHQYDLDLRIAAHNFGAPLTDDEWETIEKDLQASAVVFVIHVIDGENATRLMAALDRYKQDHAAVIVINCMPDLMRRTRMGRLNVSRLGGFAGRKGEKGNWEGEKHQTVHALELLTSTGSWVGRQVRRNKSPDEKKNGHGQYLKWIDKLPRLLRFVPSAGGLRDVKNYLHLFCYFLQPTPANIRSMVLFALKEYVPDERLTKTNVKVAPPERLPSVAIYHPDAPTLFESFAEYRNWYTSRPRSNVQCPTSNGQSASDLKLNPESTIGLLLMRPQVVSKTTRHYDTLIRAIEAEGLSVIPALSTLMDNREAVSKFFVKEDESNVQRPMSNVKTKSKGRRAKGQDSRAGSAGILPASTFVATELAGNMPALPAHSDPSRVSQIVSLTGFSFVGGPAMNDSEAAAEFLQKLNRPYRSAVSLDTQTIDSWHLSQTGLNPIQAGMQIAIPEIDGATEPFIYGGIPASGVEPIALDDRCARFARRLRRWNRLRTAPRNELKLALILFCFPPNKGNIGTAADLDVFPGLWDTLNSLKAEGYDTDVPDSAEALREMVIGGKAESFGATANVAYRMKVDEYRRLCSFVDEVEEDWGPAPGAVNSFGGELLIQGVQLGNVFVGVQPTFGYEGDPMRLMMARSGSPHHGFTAFYIYLSQVLNVDAVVHVGTHGATEFMPGKQIGLSDECWPDRLIGELPNIYLYSVNNPSEGSIAKRRSYAELISYLTPPIENAGLYRELATMKDLLMSYRQSTSEEERTRLYESIDQYRRELNFPFDEARTQVTSGELLPIRTAPPSVCV